MKLYVALIDDYSVIRDKEFPLEMNKDSIVKEIKSTILNWNKKKIFKMQQKAYDECYSGRQQQVIVEE